MRRVFLGILAVLAVLATARPAAAQEIPPPPQTPVFLEVVRQLPDGSWTTILKSSITPVSGLDAPADSLGWTWDYTFPRLDSTISTWDRWNVISGHRSSKNALFRDLPKVLLEDRVATIFADPGSTTGWTRASYRVTGAISIANDEEPQTLLELIVPKTITLRTCDGPGIYDSKGRLTDRVSKLLVTAVLEFVEPTAPPA